MMGNLFCVTEDMTYATIIMPSAFLSWSTHPPKADFWIIASIDPSITS